MKVKDILVVTLITILLYPFLLAFIMYGSGFMKVEFGIPTENESTVKVEKIRFSEFQDSLASMHAMSFKAFEQQRSELGRREERILEEENRLNDLKKEIAQRNQDLEKTRNRMEELVKESSELQKKRIKQTAQVYGSMRPEEAAPVILTLNNDLIVDIFRSMGDDRQKAKLMMAMKNIDVERTGKISKMMASIKK